LNDLRHENHTLKQEVQRMMSRLGSSQMTGDSPNTSTSSEWDRQIQQQMETVMAQEQALNEANHSPNPNSNSNSYASRRLPSAGSAVSSTHYDMRGNKSHSMSRSGPRGGGNQGRSAAGSTSQSQSQSQGAKVRPKSSRPLRGLPMTNAHAQIHLNKSASHASVMEGRLDELQRTCELQRREIQSLQAMQRGGGGGGGGTTSVAPILGRGSSAHSGTSSLSRPGSVQGGQNGTLSQSQSVQMPAIRCPTPSSSRAATAPGGMRESESAPLLAPKVAVNKGN